MLCDICLSHVNDDVDVITCTQCNATAHRTCYGPQTSISLSCLEDFHCEPCRLQMRHKIPCTLCGRKKGILFKVHHNDDKQQKNATWCHGSCSAYLAVEQECKTKHLIVPPNAEEYIVTPWCIRPEFLKELRTVATPFKCAYCESKKGKYGLTCTKCSDSFHVSCGGRNGCSFQIGEVLCAQHSVTDAVLGKRERSRSYEVRDSNTETVHLTPVKKQKNNETGKQEAPPLGAALVVASKDDGYADKLHNLLQHDVSLKQPPILPSSSSSLLQDPLATVVPPRRVLAPLLSSTAATIPVTLFTNINEYLNNFQTQLNDLQAFVNVFQESLHSFRKSMSLYAQQQQRELLKQQQQQQQQQQPPPQ